MFDQKKTPQIQLPSNFLGIPEKPLWAPAEPRTKKTKNPTKKRETRPPKQRETRFWVSKNDLNVLKTELKEKVNSYAPPKNENAKKEYMNKLWKDFLDYEITWNKFLGKAHGACAPGVHQHAAGAFNGVFHCENTIIPHIDQIADKIKNFDAEWAARTEQDEKHKAEQEAEKIWADKIRRLIKKLWPKTNELVINEWIKDKNLANGKMVTTWQQIFSKNETELLHFFAYLWKYEWHKRDFSKLYKDLTNAKIISSKKELVMKGFWAKFLEKVKDLAQTVKDKTEEAERTAAAARQAATVAPYEGHGRAAIIRKTKDLKKKAKKAKNAAENAKKLLKNFIKIIDSVNK